MGRAIVRALRFDEFDDFESGLEAIGR